MEQLREEDYNIKIEKIFDNDNEIDEILENANPISYVYEIIERHYKKSPGTVNFDSNMLMTISEFHVNNLTFLKETYQTLPNNIYCNLLNLLNLLLDLRDESINKEIISKYQSGKSLYDNQNSENEEDSTNKDPDFGLICVKKLNEIKKGLFALNLVYNKSNLSRNWNFSGIYLKKIEIEKLLDYIKTFYTPFIRLYYNFINIEKITENKKIEVIINRPLPIPPLREAVMQMQEKHQFEEQADDHIDELKFDKSGGKEKQKENDKETEEKNSQPETFKELMNKLNLNAETKKLVGEKIEELHKDVEYKILDRQKKLDEKLREIEENIKGKKK